MTLHEFLDTLQEITDEDEMLDFCRKRLLHGTPHVFRGREDDFYDFRKRIADKFNVSFHEVFVTGSAKLGFSPHKRTEFSYDSDVDVTIVSRALFDDTMDYIYNYQVDLRRSRRSIDERELDMYHEFLEYVALGWIRPDKLPLSFTIGDLKNKWFEFFRSISYDRSEVGDYKVSAGVFKGYWYLENYTMSGLRSVRRSIEMERNA